MPVKETTKTKPVPQETRPALDLSIANISVEPQLNNDRAFIEDKELTEKESDLFKTLSRDQPKPNLDISGKIFTDEDKLANRQFLDFVEGVLINIEGKFELN